MKFYLLSDFGDWAEYGQFAAAVVACILAYLAMAQTKKIKELTEISEELARQTKELQNQNVVLEKRFNHEQLLSLENRIPVFEVCSDVNTASQNLGYDIVVKNIGRKAFNIIFTFYSMDLFSVTSKSSCGSNDTLQILVRWMNLHHIPQPPLSLHMNFENNYNQLFTQEITIKDSSTFKLSPPLGPLYTNLVS